MLALCYYKNSKTLTNQGTHIYPSSGTLKLWKFSNLAIGGYLANTTLSARSFLFLSHKFCFEYVRTMWLIDDFWHHQGACILYWVTTYDNYYFDVKVGRCGFMNFVNDLIDHGCLICVIFFFLRIKEKEKNKFNFNFYSIIFLQSFFFINILFLTTVIEYL